MKKGNPAKFLLSTVTAIIIGLIARHADYGLTWVASHLFLFCWGMSIGTVIEKINRKDTK